MPNTQTIACPVDDCDTKVDIIPEPVATTALSHVFGGSLYAATAHDRARRRAEQKLDEHLATHTTAQFVQTIGRLRADLAAAKRALWVGEPA